MEKNLKVWFSSPEKKIRPHSHLTWGKCEEYHIYVAKNATEGCQVSVQSPDVRPNMSIEVLGDRKAGNFQIELLREYYVDCEGAKWPDPVVPDSGRFDLESECNVTYLINLVTNRDTVAGEYRLTVRLCEGDEIYDEYPLYITVWNFALEDGKRTYMTCDISRQFLLLRHKTDDPDALYKKYYDMLLHKYHTSAYSLPYDIDDERIDAYLDDPNVRAVHLSSHLSTEEFARYYKKLSQKDEWLKKCNIELTDEPCKMAHYEPIAPEYARICSVFPDPPTYTAFFRNPEDGGGKKATDLLWDYNHVWVPKSRLFCSEDFRDTADRLKARGDKMLWYVCWEPGLPYANFFVDMDGFFHRTLFWQQYFYGVEGLVYWTATWWRDCNPWDSASTVRDLDRYCFGDGHLLYPGDRVGIDGPVASLRLELIRSGIEDFCMLKMAEEAFGREWVEEKIALVTPSLREYNDDHDELDRVRIVIGEKLSKYFR